MGHQQRAMFWVGAFQRIMAIRIQLLLESTRTWTSKCFKTRSLRDLWLGMHTDPHKQRDQTPLA